MGEHLFFGILGKENQRQEFDLHRFFFLKQELILKLLRAVLFCHFISMIVYDIHIKEDHNISVCIEFY